MKKQKITLELIESFNPCYNPAIIGFTEDMVLTPLDVIRRANEANSNEDVIWLLCREHFMSKKDLRLFSVQCARAALKLVGNPDIRSLKACDVAEMYAYGKATEKELTTAFYAAHDAYYAYTTTNTAAAAAYTAYAAAIYNAATYVAAYYAAYKHHNLAAMQLQKLKEYFIQQ